MIACTPSSSQDIFTANLDACNNSFPDYVQQVLNLARLHAVNTDVKHIHMRFTGKSNVSHPSFTPYPTSPPCIHTFRIVTYMRLALF